MTDINQPPFDSMASGSSQGAAPSAQTRALTRFLRALEADKPEPGACERFRRLMPDAAAAELNGEAVANRFPDVVAHLDICMACALDYGELLDTLLEMETGAVTSMSPPSPRLPTQTRSALRIYDWVQQTAQQMLERVPGFLGDVETMLTTLVARLPDLTTLPVPLQAQQVALGYGADDDETPLVLATWFTTASVAERFTAAELQQLADRHALEAPVRQLAEETAKALRLGGKERRQFVDAYLQGVNRAPDEFVTLGRMESL